jgi:vibriolysin
MRLRSGVQAATLAAILASSGAFAAEMRDVGNTRLDGVVAPRAAPSGAGGEAAVGAAVARSLGLDGGSTLNLVQTTPLRNDRGRSLRFGQLYRGVPIWDQQVVVRQAADGRLLGASGTAVFGLAATAGPAPTPAIDAAAALRIGIDSVLPKTVRRQGTIENETSDLVYRLAEGGDLQLVYKVSFFAVVEGADGPRPTRPVIFVDAADGRIVDSYENLQHINRYDLERSRHKGTGPGGNEKVGRYKYGTGIFPKFLITRNGGECLLDADNYLQTEDLDNQPVATNEPFAFPCFNNPGIAVHGAYSPMNDAQAMGEVVYDLYYNWYGTTPLAGRKLLLRVRFATPQGQLDNAFWNGVAMTFGNGDTLFYPLVSLDVTGHEVSHGFTEFHAGLIYREQTGGINESFSDMAGVATEAYFAERYGQPFDYRIPNFEIGQEITLGDLKALRYMCNPPKDGRSIDDAADFTPGMDPHLSSGVYNKAFCLLSKSDGWSIKKAFEVFVTANESYWVPRTNYESGAVGTLQAATLLGYRTDKVSDAFAAVGIDLPVLTVGAPTGSFSGKKGGPFGPTKVKIKLSAPIPTNFDVAGVPKWLKLSETSGVVRDKSTIELTLTSAAKRLKQSETAELTFFNDTDPGQKPINRRVEIKIEP